MIKEIQETNYVITTPIGIVVRLAKDEAQQLFKELEAYFGKPLPKGSSKYKKALEDIVQLHTPGICSDPLHCATTGSNIARVALGLPEHGK